MIGLRVLMMVTIIAPVVGPVTAGEAIKGAYEVLGSERDWSVLRWSNGDQDICTGRTLPSGRNGDFTEGEAVAFLTMEPGSERRVFSYTPGASVEMGDAGAHVVVDDDTKIALIGVGDTLYAQPADDDRLVRALRRGKEAVIFGETAAGGSYSDTLSLMGVIASGRLMENADC